MALLTRLIRLLKADVHGLLDSLEEPEDVVKQTIRDMEEALAHKAHALAELRTALERLMAEDTAVARARQDLEQHIELCFQAGNPTLARNFLRKKLEAERHARQVTLALDATRTQHAVLEQTIAEQRQQLAAVVQQLNLHRATRQHRETSAGAAPPWYGNAGITDDEVEVAFLEEQRRRTGTPQAH